MFRSKEGERFVSLENLSGTLHELNLPGIIQERLVERIDEVPLGELFESLSEEEKRGIKKELKEDLKDEFMKENAHLFDEYLGLVIRRLFSISLNELSAQERRDVEDIRKQLEIPGDFDPNA